MIHGILAFISFATASEIANADLVKLVNGGELRGKIVRGGNSKQLIRLETLTGALVIVERNQTQFITMRSAAIEEYETRVRRLGDEEVNWEVHWDLSEWCRQRGLSKQRETHLRRVTELAPEHDKAQSALGRIWHQGAWVDRDELMASKGLVKYKSKYVTPQELEIIEKSADELQRERSWFQKIRLWHGWLDGSNEDRLNTAIKEFKNIEDPHAATAVIKFLGSDPRSHVRELSVASLIKMGGSKAIVGLVKMALFDESPDVRSVALEGIGRDYYHQAQNAFVQALGNEYNTVVCRAAMALGQIGDKKAVGPLIDALVTVHSYQVTSDVPVNQTYSFATDGSVGGNATALPAGVQTAVRNAQLLPAIIVPAENSMAKKTVTVRVEHFNSDVLDALEKLTEQNFGYDKRTWSLWWAAEKNQAGKPVK